VGEKILWKTPIEDTVAYCILESEKPRLVSIKILPYTLKEMRFEEVPVLFADVVECDLIMAHNPSVVEAYDAFSIDPTRPFSVTVSVAKVVLEESDGLRILRLFYGTKPLYLEDLEERERR